MTIHHSTARKLILLGLLILQAFAPSAFPEEGPLYRDEAPPIVWKNSRQATVEASVRSWKKEFKQLNLNPTFRKYRLIRRRIYLLRKLPEKFPPKNSKQLIKHRRDLARSYQQLGRMSQAERVCQKMLANHPDNSDIRDAALEQLLELGKKYPPALIMANREARDFLPPAEETGEGVTSWPQVWKNHVKADQFTTAADLLWRYKQQHIATDWWIRAWGTTLAAAGAEGQAIKWLQNRGIDSAIESEWKSSPPPIVEMAKATKLNPEWTDEDFTWAAVRVGMLIREEAQRRMLCKQGSRYISLWHDLDARLRNRPDLQQRIAAARPPKQIGKSPSRVLSTFRKHPWSTDVHKALLKNALHELRRGHAGLAYRYFSNVLQHTSNSRMQREATAGVWTSLALLGHHEALTRRTKSFPKNTTLPWRGESVTGEKLATRLSRMTEKMPQSSDSPNVRPLRMPTSALQYASEDEARGLFNRLSGIGVKTTGNVITAAGTRGVALYDKKTGKRQWFSQGPVTDLSPGAKTNLQPEDLTARMSGELVFTRWGVDRNRNQPVGVAALDAEDGHVVWSTLKNESWGNLFPANDPVPSDGRVYVMASRGEELNQQLFLLCLRASDGEILWRRHLATQDGRPFLPWGNAVTVHLGSVYFQTNTGIVGRCDARDGMMRWIHTYSRPADDSYFMTRPGSPPMVTDGRVVFNPRDFPGLLALSTTDGKKLWSRYFLPRHTALADSADRIICYGRTGIRAVAASSGQTAWAHDVADQRFYTSFVKEAISPGVMDGSIRLCIRNKTVWMANEKTLRGFHLEDGSRVDSRQLPGQVAALTGSEKHIYAVMLGPLALDQPPATAGFPIPNTLFQSTNLSDAQLCLPDSERHSQRVFIDNTGVLQAIRTQKNVPTWRSLIPPHFAGPFSHKNKLAFQYADQFVLLDINSGNIQNHIPLFAPRAAHWRQHNQYLAIGQGQSWITVLNLETNHVWTRRLLKPYHSKYYRRTLKSLSWQSGLLQVTIFRKTHRHEKKNRDLRRIILDPADGTILFHERRPLGPSAWPRWLVHVQSKRGFELWKERKGHSELELRRYPLGSPGTNQMNVSDDGDMGILGDDDPLGGNSESKALDVKRRFKVKSFRPLDKWVHAHAVRGNKHLDWLVPSEGIDWISEKDSFESVARKTTGYGKLPLAVHNGRVYSARGRALEVLIGQKQKRTLPRYVLPEAVNGERARAILDYRINSEKVELLARSWTKHHNVVFSARYKKEGELLTWEPLVTGPHKPEEAFFRGQKIFVLTGDRLNVFPRKHHLKTKPLAAAYQSLGTVFGKEGGGSAPRLKISNNPRAHVSVAHKRHNLYLKVDYAEASPTPKMSRGLQADGSWLELHLEGRGTVAAGMRPDGTVDVETFGPMPENVRATIWHDARTQQLHYQFIFPDFLRGAAAIRPAIRAWHGEHQRLFAWQPRGRFHLRAYTARAAEIADAYPNLHQSWELITSDVPTDWIGAGAVVYAQFLRDHPRSSYAVPAMMKLRRQWGASHRNPREDVIKLATESGVKSADLRAFKKLCDEDETRPAVAPRISGPALKQWVYISEDNRPLSLSLFFTDGWRTERFYWGEEVPEQAVAMGPVPQAGEWTELRIPLAHHKLGDMPITALKYSHNGGTIWWDKLTFVNGTDQRTILDEEDDEQKLKSTNIRWATRNPHSGKQVWQTDNDTGTSGYFQWNEGALDQHTQVDLKGFVRTVEKYVADIGWDRFAERADYLLYLWNKSRRRAELRKRLLISRPYINVHTGSTGKQKPGSGKMQLLRELVELYRHLDMNPRKATQKVYRRVRPYLTPAQRFRFNRKMLGYRGRLIKKWQILGPLPHDQHHAQPLKTGVHIGARYQGFDGYVGWKTMSWPEGTIDLKQRGFRPFDKKNRPKDESADVFAAVWLHADKPKTIVIHDVRKNADRNKRRIDGQTRRKDTFEYGDTTYELIELKAGWNELVRYIGAKGSESPSWKFHIELIAVEGDGPPSGIKVRATPPEDDGGN